MPDEGAGNGAIDKSRRSMGLLRLGRSRWTPSESSKRSMSLLRLGRSGDEASNRLDDAEKRSMQLLRLGRSGNVDDILEPEAEADQLRPHRSSIIRRLLLAPNQISSHRHVQRWPGATTRPQFVICYTRVGLCLTIRPCIPPSEQFLSRTIPVIMDIPPLSIQCGLRAGG